MKKNVKYSFELGTFYPTQEKHNLTSAQVRVIESFHHLYFDLLEKKSGLQISWLGHQTGKTPLDLWVYQELIVKNKPDFIIETGTHWGGSAVFLSTICNLLGSGEVLSIDLYPKEKLPKVDRLNYLHGSSTDDVIIEEIKKSQRTPHQLRRSWQHHRDASYDGSSINTKIMTQCSASVTPTKSICP